MQIPQAKNLPVLFRISSMILWAVLMAVMSLGGCAKNFDVSIFDTEENNKKNQEDSVNGVDYVFSLELTTIPVNLNELSGHFVTTVIKNIGLVNSQPGAQVNLYLSRNQQIEPSSVLLKTVTLNYGIAAKSQSENINLGFELPLTQDNGAYYFILQITSDEQQEDKSNNLYVSSLSQVGRANLVDMEVLQIVHLADFSYKVYFDITKCVSSGGNQSITLKVKLAELGGGSGYGYNNYDIGLNLCGLNYITIDLQSFGFSIQSGRSYQVDVIVDPAGLTAEDDGLNNYYGPYSIIL